MAYYMDMSAPEEYDAVFNTLMESMDTRPFIEAEVNHHYDVQTEFNRSLINGFTLEPKKGFESCALSIAIKSDKLPADDPYMIARQNVMLNELGIPADSESIGEGNEQRKFDSEIRRVIYLDRPTGEPVPTLVTYDATERNVTSVVLMSHEKAAIEKKKINVTSYEHRTDAELAKKMGIRMEDVDPKAQLSQEDKNEHMYRWDDVQKEKVVKVGGRISTALRRYRFTRSALPLIREADAIAPITHQEAYRQSIEDTLDPQVHGLETCQDFLRAERSRRLVTLESRLRRRSLMKGLKDPVSLAFLGLMTASAIDAANEPFILAGGPLERSVLSGAVILVGITVASLYFTDRNEEGTLSFRRLKTPETLQEQLNQERQLASGFIQIEAEH